MKKFTTLMMAAVLTLSFVGCSGAEEIVEIVDFEINGFRGTEKSYSVENDFLKLTVDASTTHFTLQDKESGAVWYSNPPDSATDAIAGGDNKNLLEATLLVEYMDSIGVGSVMNNYSYSIEEGLYDITTGEDFIQIDYTIGSLEREFIIPLVISEERFLYYTSFMDTNVARRTTENYKKYDINNLSRSDTEIVDELLEKYPAMEHEVVYVLRETVQDYLKIEMETLFADAGYTLEEYEADLEERENTDNLPIFNISVIYRLDGADFVVELPVELMEWKDDYPLIEVSVLPMFGAGGLDDEGYFIVPDGVGAMIEFNNDKTEHRIYQSYIYGFDYGGKRDALFQDNSSVYNAYVVANNDASVVCISEEGASLATLRADVSGKSHSYNTAYLAYKIVKHEQISPSYKSYQTIIMFDENVPDITITQRYKLVDSDNYNDAADAYREYLIDEFALEPLEQDGVPLYIEIIGAIDDVQQRFGIPTDVIVPLTTFAEAEDIIVDMTNMGFENFNVVYSGWLSGGVNHDFIGNVDPLKELGGESGFENMIATANSLGVPVYLNAKVQSSEGGTFFDGFIKGDAVAEHITREYNVRYPYSYVWYGQLLARDSFYMLTPDTVVNSVQVLSDMAAQFGASGVALQDVGNIIIGDYNEARPYNREQVIDRYDDGLAYVGDNGQNLLTSGGHTYTLSNSNEILNLDLTGNQFAIFDNSVPFYTLALHGLVNYTDTPINLGGDYNKSILQAVETGAGLSFAFMQEETAVLVNTLYTYLYGTNYDSWKDKAFAIYDRYNEELGHCFGMAIVDHEILADGVAVTTYADGTKAFVNYTPADFYYSRYEIPSMDYLVVKGAN